MRVRKLWHYPVKSLLGEAVQQLSFDTRGVIGDRLYAILNAEGKLGSGKSTLRFARIDNLFSLFARSQEGSVEIVFPDGATSQIGSAELNKLLSDFLGQTVTLEQEAEVPHHDDGAVHLLLTSELAKLQRLVPEAQIDPRRFRANLLLETPDHISGDAMLEKELVVGGTRLLVTHKTERCRMVTLPQEELVFDPRVLRGIAQEFDVNFGLYAKVLEPGSISVGQRVFASSGATAKRRRDAGDLGI